MVTKDYELDVIADAGHFETFELSIFLFFYWAERLRITAFAQSDLF